MPREPTHLVLRSIETDDSRRCVDIFQRQDGTFGFEEYVREPEENFGWRPASFTSALIYDSEKQALAAAQQRVGWLAQD